MVKLLDYWLVSYLMGLKGSFIEVFVVAPFVLNKFYSL